jgi:hypothetical protein
MPAAHHLRVEPKFVPVARPTYRRSIDNVIELVARLAGMSPQYLTRTGPKNSFARCNARSAVTVLALEFCPLMSERACDEAMHYADEGMTRYYRQRHADRCALFDEYRQLYIRARIALMAAQ